MQNKDLPFCIIFVNFTFASRKNKHLREQDAMSNEMCITGWVKGAPSRVNAIKGRNLDTRPIRRWKCTLSNNLTGSKGSSPVFRC